MTLPTEPIGSVPRPHELLSGIREFDAGRLTRAELDVLVEDAVRDTIRRLEATGSPVISDGEQSKPSFATYPIDGLSGLAPDGVEIPFEDGHVRRLPRLTKGPFQYARYADEYLLAARGYTGLPLKQAVIAASALSLLYPEAGIDGYSRAEFLEDLVNETATDVRRCLAAGAHVVQMDFTEGRLALKLDPSGGLLREFVNLNNRVLRCFSDDERPRLGVHTCPGADLGVTHSAGVDYGELLPVLFELQAGNFYIQLASEPDRRRVLEIIRDHSGPEQRIFVGVIDPVSPEVETPEQVRDRVLEAARIIGIERLGTTDDCGFSPFADDTSMARETAFAKIRARVEGTALASEAL